jgi:hypothetical protein
MPTPPPPTPPGAESPPVDAFLGVTADEIAAAVAEANTACDDLAREVLALARHASESAAAQDAAHDALLRIQAIAQLGRRLGDADRNLRALAFLLRETGQRPSKRDWIAFLAAVRGRYATESERTRFDLPGPPAGARDPVPRR